MKKKVVGIIITIVVLLILAGVGVTVIYPMVVSGDVAVSDVDSAYVEQISVINSGFQFTSNRYSGTVETEEVVSVDADLDKKIKETFVQAGDDVKIGDKLFEYDVEEMQLQLDQSKLDLEQAQSETKSYTAQIETLEKQKKNATVNQQLSITNQIEELNLRLTQANYTVETKEKEIQKLEKSINNAVVKATVNGKIQTVNSDGMSTDTSAYITIASSGDYRIKALVSEENIYSINEGDKILVRSRIDDTMTWTGTVSGIDTAKPTQESNVYSTETTTKYPIYVALDSTDGMMIGQHVTIELDFGDEEKSGLWLPEYYICDADASPYVWAEGAAFTLEKRSVELGEYDEENMEYEILSGVTEDDYIAFPEDRFYEGLMTTYNAMDENITYIGDGENLDGEVGIIGGADGEEEVYVTGDGTYTTVIY